MSDKKYYFPDIFEFYVGFEYEMYNRPIEGNEEGISQSLDGSWCNRTVGNGVWDLQSQVVRLMKHNCIRVKYLDQADVESFNFIKQEEENKYHADNGMIVLWYNPDGNWVQIRADGDTRTIFYGQVKSKGALRLVLRMLKSNFNQYTKIKID